ncbi:carboxypeptidase regulatory-like domain-containing protein [candidate division WOR-3 bacterium]|nr:carboxypeptidase regulatory-like domain-containing protein [candidate division WOR-3 bacterium]
MTGLTTDRRGFTLMELLVVLLIIGVLSTVAIRTIDATRNRVLFEQTTKEMKELVDAIVGDPDLMAEGRRVDFGFYGDMGRLPLTLQELVENTQLSPYWRGPYFRRGFAGDSLGHAYDAWGNPYTWDDNTGLISSLGDGNFPMTMRVADSLAHLNTNIISGSVSDGDNNPPPEGAATVVRLYTSSGGILTEAVDDGGYYEFDAVPVGQHKLVARYAGFDSINRWVAVSPRTRTVVDFRFSRPFRNLLKLVGEPLLGSDSSSFLVRIVNDHLADILISSIYFVEGPDSAYFRELMVEGETYANYTQGIGAGDTAQFSAFAVPANRASIVDLRFVDFYVTPSGPPDPKATIESETFRLRFSDGSEITVELPDGP